MRARMEWSRPVIQSNLSRSVPPVFAIFSTMEVEFEMAVMVSLVPWMIQRGSPDSGATSPV